MFKDVSNTLTNLTFMETTGFEITGVPPPPPPPLIKGVGSKRLGKGTVKRDQGFYFGASDIINPSPL